MSTNQLPWDLSQAIGVAVQETQESQSKKKNAGEGGWEHKLIYPGDGKLKVKILYNPKARVTQRKIIRHKIDDVRLPCLELYGQECPIDKLFDEVWNVKGVDLWASYGAKTYGIAYAQFISAEGLGGGNYFPGWNAEDIPQPGETIFLMYPPSMYRELNRIITEAGQNAHMLIATNVGRPVVINKFYEGNKTSPTYKVEVDAWGDYRSFNTDEEFVNALNNLPDLNEKMCPREASNEVLQSIREVCDQLREKHLKGNVLNPGQDPNQMPSNSGAVAGLGQANVQGAPPANNTGYVIPANQQNGYVQNPTPTAQPQQNQGYVQTLPPANNAQPVQNAGYVQNPPPANTPPVQNPPVSTPPQQQAPVNNPTPPSNPPVVQTPPPTPNAGVANKPAGAPECYGDYKKQSAENPNKCLACPHELQCDEASSK